MNYNVRVFFENRVINFAGAIVYDAAIQPSPECIPNNAANAELNVGYYVGNFSCTCCGANYLVDRNNCGRCGNVCKSWEVCSSGACLGTGQVEIESTWQRLGDLNLYVDTLDFTEGVY